MVCYMSYTALYRKFRPDTFFNVKGQDHIVTTLKNQIKAERVGHAYLFCGTRGTGKTTIAKIFARAVNCERPNDGSPCGECYMCRSIMAQSSMNVIEIDAASNNGVDNIREIVEEVRYSPAEGKYKVYIIDEVHMLSSGAFNALLKTLEEPPSYVIFILATTEVHKIPVTILSRCQRYDFKRIRVDIIVDRLYELIKQEGVEAEEKALRYIARVADGALRDALSLLDQCISFYLGRKLTYDNVLEVLGTVDVEIFARLLRYIRKTSVEECIELLEEVIMAGRDLTQLALDFTWYLRNLLLVKSSENLENILEVSTDQLMLLKQEAASIGGELLIRYIHIFSDVSSQMKYAAQKRLLLEIAIIKLCKPQMETDYSSLVNRITLLEQDFANGAIHQAPIKEDSKLPNEPEEKKENELLPRALSEDMQAIAASWNAICRRTSPLVRTVLIGARPSPLVDNQLLLLFDSAVDKEVIDKEEHIKEIEAAIAAQIGKEVKVQTKLIRDGKETLEDFSDLTRIFKNIPIQFID